MSESGSGGVTDEVKVSTKVRRSKRNDNNAQSSNKTTTTTTSTVDGNNAIFAEGIKIEQDTECPLDVSETIQHNGNEDDDDDAVTTTTTTAAAAAPVVGEKKTAVAKSTSDDDPNVVDTVDVEELDDEATQDADIFGLDKDSDVEGGLIDEDEQEQQQQQSTCFKIDKVYSVATSKGGGGGGGGENNNKQTSSRESETSRTSKRAEVKTEKTPKNINANVVEEIKRSVVIGGGIGVIGGGVGAREEKPLKPKTTLTTLAKMPTLAGGVGGVRLLSGGIRGPSMPLLVSMGAGNPGIPLLPAGLPPGRYVILPGTSTTTKTTCATVNTTSASMAPRLATGVTTPVAAVVGQATSATTTTTTSSSSSTSSSTTTTSATTPSATVAAAVVAAAARSITPTLQIPARPHPRERGRRKSYTTGEKLAMIEAVEAGQRKSTVADRFGVAPSTLACILAQKNKIRAEQDNLTRRRFRHVKYLSDDGRGSSGGSSSSNRIATSATPTLQTLTTTQDQPFTHFLASLTGPAPAVFDTQPEEIIAVPDLVERLEGGPGGGSSCVGGGGGGTDGGMSGFSDGKGDAGDDDDDDGGSGVECLGVIEGSGGGSMDVEYQHESSHNKSSAIFGQQSRCQQTEAIEEAVPQDISDRPSSPGSQGLTGPYLLKKETHCTTVLDQLLRDETYTDVTLTAEGQSLRAHRIVLCLASPYFRQVLSREQNIQSVVLLRDVKFAELRNIIHFIYTGEATVDASDLESFMRTAEMLEITSLSEGQKYISNRGLTQGGGSGPSSGFSIGDFERLVGAKRSNKEASPSPSKSRRTSGEDPSSRSSSTEPSPSTIPLTFIKEEPNTDLPSTSQEEKIGSEKAIGDQLSSSEATPRETKKSEREVTGSKRKRRESSESIGGFASIAGLQKTSSEAEDDEEVFSPAPKSKARPSEDHNKPINSETNNISLPGRCPYCPHVEQKYEGVAMMRHLLVSHPCKPAFPCSFCWRVFVKRSNFKSHLQTCPNSY